MIKTRTVIAVIGTLCCLGFAACSSNESARNTVTGNSATPSNSIPERVIETARVNSNAASTTPMPKPVKKQAEGDSEFERTGGENAMEIRRFNSHPVIERAERTLGSKGRSVTRIYLRDGKVVPVRANIESLETVSADELARLAGHK